MNKTQAAEYLEIGVRSLERYMSQGRIAYTRQRGKTGETVFFNEVELERFKEELHSPRHEGAIEVRQGSPSISSQMVMSSEMLAGIGESLINMSEAIDGVLEILKDMVYRVPVHAKTLLTLGEAQRMTGLGRPFLLQAIKDGRLSGEKIGKAWRVRRRDLEKFTEELF